jgi:hypothetical protein
MGSGISIVIQEVALDGGFIRFALLSLIPILFAVSLVRHTNSIRLKRAVLN